MSGIEKQEKQEKHEKYEGALPPVLSSDKKSKRPRKFLTQLSADNYLKLEMDALNRGVTPYSLVESILGLYLTGRLVPSESVSHSTGKEE